MHRCRPLPLRVLLPLAAGFTGAACVTPPPPALSAPGACVAIAGTPRWAVPDAGVVRDLRVWIDAEAQEFDGWSTYGWTRVRRAIAPWNALQLPVRFVEGTSRRDADVVIAVLQTVPSAGAGRDGDQAGITNLTVSPQNEILQAHVFIAVSTPLGQRFRVPAQEAHLLHELGHAIGLAHAGVSSAVMAPQSTAGRLVAADYALARTHYGVCGPVRR